MKQRGTAADAQEEAGQLQGQDSNKNCTSVMQMMRRPPSLHTSGAEIALDLLVVSARLSPGRVVGAGSRRVAVS